MAVLRRPLQHRVALGRDPERGALAEGRDGRALVSPVQLLPGLEGCYKMGACRYSVPAAAAPDADPDAEAPRPLAEDGVQPP